MTKVYSLEPPLVPRWNRKSIARMLAETQLSFMYSAATGILAHPLLSRTSW
ncbi:MAG: hypothetical protein K0R29_414 [Pseudobdellovibrio sp.]|jgi:hypothetical protein|nr:hypothetical protein [Pseudobdellovibrio sp.]